MPKIKVFEKLDVQIRKTIAEKATYREIVTAVSPLVSELLVVEDLVPKEYRVPLKDRYGQYLLYKPEDECFSVVAFVWGKGHDSPVHDHLVWGVIGLVEGAVEETRYKATSGDGLKHVSTVTSKKGDISYVYPPDYDIHGVSNPYDEPAITLHIYGTDIGKQPRHTYDVDSGVMTPIVTKHRLQQAYYVHDDITKTSV